MIIRKTLKTLLSLSLLAAMSVQAQEAVSPLDTMLPNDLLARARQEGKVTVYSLSKRIDKVEKAFETAYPGIDLEGVYLKSDKQIARLKEEAQAGRIGADVVYLANAAQAITDLLETGIIESYVPPRVASRIDEENKTPLLAHRLSTKVLMYNEEAHPLLAPVDNIWELTLPKWRGKVVIVDPLKRADYIDLFTEFVLRSDVMDSAYRAQFRRKLDLGEARNAGERFIMDLYANGLVLLNSTDEVNAAVGKLGQMDPPVGFTSYSDRRDNEKEGWALQVSNGTTPSAGISYPTILALTKDTKHPAAARLFIDFIMGDETELGGEAYAPFYAPGEYAARNDIPTHPDSMPLPNLGAWATDPVKTAKARGRVEELVRELQQNR
ncbi:MAG: ABC transporter substrate-binding protein [Cardiobacteriaceae bacterium]|nr:ABC transporter substrate-binding protein [Cardiobacteriaceae bacterium]